MHVRTGTGKRKCARIFVSRLTVIIIATNLAGLVILLAGSFGLTRYRDSLVDAKLESVRAQARIIADVLAQIAIDETPCRAAGGPGYGRGARDGICPAVLSKPEVSEVFNRVRDSFEGRVRVFAAPGQFESPAVTDARVLLLEDADLRTDRITVEMLGPAGSGPGRVFRRFRSGLDFLEDILFYPGPGGHIKDRTIEDELNAALATLPFAGEETASSVRLNEEGEAVASVSVPVRRLHAIYGIVTAEVGGIDTLLREARLSVIPFFGLAVVIAVLSSVLLNVMIAWPIQKLALAADRIREGTGHAGPVRLPDFSRRRDEIGQLSRSLKLMTEALYARMGSIENFAADVSHELKNPLTSIRSATDALRVAKDSAQADRMTDIIRKDVSRMDRLITDISHASRLDTVLAREQRKTVDMNALIGDIVAAYHETARPGETDVVLCAPAARIHVRGNADVLSQVFRNLIDNARSFSPPGAVVRVVLDAPSVPGGTVRVCVEDEGPGIPEEDLESIFRRFHTRRPSDAEFAGHSGLGLSISKQIVDSYGGKIHARNRPCHSPVPGRRFAGAVFVVEFPGC